MKIKAIILAITLALCSLIAVGQNNVFEKLEETKDIQKIHVSKSLLAMISKMETGGTDIASLADKLTQIDSYSSETKESAVFMKTQSDVFAKSKAYETFMTVRDKGYTTVFYGQKKGDKFNDLIMVVNEASSCKIMRFVGEFTAKDIQQVIKKKK